MQPFLPATDCLVAESERLRRLEAGLAEDEAHLGTQGSQNLTKSCLVESQLPPVLHSDSLIAERCGVVGVGPDSKAESLEVDMEQIDMTLLRKQETREPCEWDQDTHKLHQSYALRDHHEPKVTNPLVLMARKTGNGFQENTTVNRASTYIWGWLSSIIISRIGARRICLAWSWRWWVCRIVSLRSYWPERLSMRPIYYGLLALGVYLTTIASSSISKVRVGGMSRNKGMRL